MTTRSSSDPKTPRKGRLPLLLALTLAAIVALIYFLPSKKAQTPQPELPVVTNQPPAIETNSQPPSSNASSTSDAPSSAGDNRTEAEKIAWLLAKPMPLTPGTKLPLSLDPKSNRGIELGPSVGSLAALPKPRKLAMDDTEWRSLPPKDAIITPRTAEEAAWMDLRDFPTHQELEELSIMPDADIKKLYAMRQLRALAVQVVLICQKSMDMLCDAGIGRLVSFGHPFGTRLRMVYALQKREPSFETIVLRAALVGQQLGDNYTPRLNQFQDRDLRPQHSILDVMYSNDSAAYVVQVTIPRTREKFGLPPLNVIRMPTNRMTGAR